jgi:hypothetical protein
MIPARQQADIDAMIAYQALAMQAEASRCAPVGREDAVDQRETVDETRSQEPHEVQEPVEEPVDAQENDPFVAEEATQASDQRERIKEHRRSRTTRSV